MWQRGATAVPCRRMIFSCGRTEEPPVDIDPSDFLAAVL